MHLTTKHIKNVPLPESTKMAILEDESEEDYDDETEPAPKKEDLTNEGICREIIDQCLSVIFEAHDETNLSKYEIVDN